MTDVPSKLLFVCKAAQDGLLLLILHFAGSGVAEACCSRHLLGLRFFVTHIAHSRLALSRLWNCKLLFVLLLAIFRGILNETIALWSFRLINDYIWFLLLNNWFAHRFLWLWVINRDLRQIVTFLLQLVVLFTFCTSLYISVARATDYHFLLFRKLFLWI